MASNIPSPAELAVLGPVRAAAYWLSRLDRDDHGDEAEFRAWLDASEANQRAWDDAVEMWDSFDEVDASDEVMLMREEALSFRSRPSFQRWLPYAAAASIAVVAFGLATQRLQDLPFGGVGSGGSAGQSELARFGAPDFATTSGERRSVALSDGTQLILEPDTEVDIAYRQDARLVRLVHGSVLFDVARNVHRPLRVAAGERIVTVLGTRFTVSAVSGRTRVQLFRGSVGVSAGRDPARPTKDSVRLFPGQELVTRGGLPDLILPIAPQAREGSENGLVEFDDRPLEEVIEQINARAVPKLVVRDKRLRKLRISGAFPSQEGGQFAEALTALYPIRVRRLNDGTLELLPR